MLKKGDFIIFAIILGLTTMIIVNVYKTRYSDEGELMAKILIDGNLEDTIKLDNVKNSYEYSPKNNPSIKLIVDNGRIRFIESDCHDKICIKTGWLSAPGDTSVCLPEKTVVVLYNSKQKDDLIDVISH
ncbi:MAG: NusG domain II-containing protein [Clostridiales bacterium]